MNKINGYTLIPIYAGKSIELEFEVRKEGQLVDLSDLTGRLVVFLEVPGVDEEYVIDESLTIPDQTGGGLGTCSVILDSTMTDQYAAVYRYYLLFTYGTGDERVLQDGTINIIADDTDRINQIKTKYGLEFDHYTLVNAYNYSHSQLLNCGYEYVDKTIENLDDNNCFLIDNYAMDANFDGKVDIDDIEIIEYQKNSPYNINNLNDNVDEIKFNHPGGKIIVQMDAKYPSEGSYKIRVRYYKGLQSYSYLINDINYLEELYMIFHLFEIMPIYKLQHGITKRDINGVKVEFNKEAIDAFKDDLRKQITYQVSKIRSLNIKPVIINKDYGGYKPILHYGPDYSASRYRFFDR